MSLIRWLFPAKKSKAVPGAPAAARTDANRAGARREPVPPSAPTSSRKEERMAQRELLYAVVRQAMMRAGVLSSGYKFKVLSLDAKGRHFMVMVDLASSYAHEAARLSDIEAMIAQGAKSGHAIVVEGVYWRMHEHVAVGDAATPHASAQSQRPATSQPAALDSQPAALDSAPGALGDAGGRNASRYEPIQADEVAAFKNALAAGVSGPAALAAAAPARNAAAARAPEGAASPRPHSYTLLTGFEDTELPDARMPVLSGTQYGDLH